MRGESHRRLGNYLARRYMPDVPEKYITAFMVGCIEPDRNPLTYLKGSFRHQWLRGHNYRNAKRFMRRISKRLEQKDHWSILDYYTLGKLMHYTTDAFTYAHNDTFPTELSCHRHYEIELQNHFLNYLKEDPKIDIMAAKSVMDAISGYHKEYESQTSSIHTDAWFAVAACCCALTILMAKTL